MSVCLRQQGCYSTYTFNHTIVNRTCRCCAARIDQARSGLRLLICFALSTCQHRGRSSYITLQAARRWSLLLAAARARGRRRALAGGVWARRQEPQPGDAAGPGALITSGVDLRESLEILHVSAYSTGVGRACSASPSRVSLLGADASTGPRNGGPLRRQGRNVGLTPATVAAKSGVRASTSQHPKPCKGVKL